MSVNETEMPLHDIMETGLGEAEVLLDLLRVGWCTVNRGILKLAPNALHYLEIYKENLHEKVKKVYV